VRRCLSVSGYHYFRKDDRPNVWQCVECDYRVLLNTEPADMGDCFMWIARQYDHDINHVHIRTKGTPPVITTAPWINASYALGCCNSDLDWRGRHYATSDDPHSIVLASLN
jgi:hypothetical protein